MKDMEIKFSDVPHDFSAWMQEKCGNILMSLCRTLQEHPDVQNIDAFRCAIDNALKVYALCCENLNGIYCPLVKTLLLTHNIEGYLYLEDLIFDTRNSHIMREILQTKRNEKVLVLIEQNDKSNRTKIARLLALITQPNLWIKEVSDDIELVHNGEKTWEWFYNKHKNDRLTFRPYFRDDLIKAVYKYFKSDAYKLADVQKA